MGMWTWLRRLAAALFLPRRGSGGTIPPVHLWPETYKLIDSLREQGRYEEAMARTKEALRWAREKYGPEDHPCDTPWRLRRKLPIRSKGNRPRPWDFWPRVTGPKVISSRPRRFSGAP
jgi:hypothetical protein